ncbi:MAG: LPS export ABC transporter periplasmic protein LptC [Gammaproteobacteria bacterium]|nr:LPS export ABC transporter periplasmic protein LptC [Gammaproteobacteria bacterium]MDE2461271.1 LPS export ABC transporter periplasmic protein LptC [Gammaproteobacteria bacterium]
MSARFALAILVLALAAAGTWWLLRHVTPPTVPPPAPPTHVPDYSFTDATVTTFNAQGNPQAILRSPRMLHHPDDDSIEVFAPRIQYFISGSPPWNAAADQALLPAGGNLVELEGHVQMQHPANNNGPPLLIQTDKMNVDLDTNIATTADPVAITQGNSRMTGVGLQAWLNDNRLLLQSQVRGAYVRKP